MFRKIMFSIFLITLFACTDNERTIHILKVAGYTNISITGYAMFKCHDQYCTGFTATGPTGEAAIGAVGCGDGCGKGCTVRLD